MEFVIYALKNISLTYFKPGKQKSKPIPKVQHPIKAIILAVDFI